jgi:hypothetical protein
MLSPRTKIARATARLGTLLGRAWSRFFGIQYDGARPLGQLQWLGQHPQLPVRRSRRSAAANEYTSAEAAAERC